MPIFSSAPADPLAESEVIGTREQILAAVTMQQQWRRKGTSEDNESSADANAADAAGGGAEPDGGEEGGEPAPPPPDELEGTSAVGDGDAPDASAAHETAAAAGASGPTDGVDELGEGGGDGEGGRSLGSATGGDEGGDQIAAAPAVQTERSTALARARAARGAPTGGTRLGQLPDEDEDGAGEAEGGATEGEDGGITPVFTVRNLDTGETVELNLTEALEKAPRSTRSTEAWEALKDDSKGLLEKLASAKTVSFRSYQLCVWQASRHCHGLSLGRVSAQHAIALSSR